MTGQDMTYYIQYGIRHEITYQIVKLHGVEAELGFLTKTRIRPSEGTVNPREKGLYNMT